MQHCTSIFLLVFDDYGLYCPVLYCVVLFRVEITLVEGRKGIPVWITFIADCNFASIFDIALVVIIFSSVMCFHSNINVRNRTAVSLSIWGTKVPPGGKYYIPISLITLAQVISIDRSSALYSVFSRLWVCLSVCLSLLFTKDKMLSIHHLRLQLTWIIDSQCPRQNMHNM